MDARRRLHAADPGDEAIVRGPERDLRRDAEMAPAACEREQQGPALVLEGGRLARCGGGFELALLLGDLVEDPARVGPVEPDVGGFLAELLRPDEGRKRSGNACEEIGVFTLRAPLLG